MVPAVFASEAVTISGDTTDSPEGATVVTELESEELMFTTDPSNEVPGVPEKTTLDPNEGQEPTLITTDSTEEGVTEERGFQTTPEATDEDQRTSPTEVTIVRIPDDTTGSGIMPTTEEILETHTPVEKETLKPMAELPPEQPESKPESNTG